jgi:hypothetical protein
VFVSLGERGESLRRLIRIAFWCYAVATFVATHWPNLRIESSVIDRPDILIHMTVFGTWAFLLAMTGYLEPASKDPLAESRGVPGWVRLVTRPRTLLFVGFTAAIYAAFDELSQGVPGLGRTVAWDDYGANCLGICVGAATAAALGRAVRRDAS